MSKKSNKTAAEPTLLQKYNAVQEIGNVQVPWEVWTVFGENSKVASITGTEICLGEDYVGIDRARQAVEWYVRQLGGTVKWD